MPVFDNVLQAIGRTPLVRIHKLVGAKDAAVYAKCEFMNPGGAIKDRMAMYILDKAEREGRVKPGATIVENTSGNTGMGVALWAAVKGYRCVFTMPDKMSSEKVNALKAFGAEVVVTPTNVAGEDMLCKAMDFTVLDDVRRVDDKQSFQAARRLAREEGLFGGGSSGSAIHVAVDLAHEMGKGKNVVVILPDSGSRYITKFYSDEWMKDNGFLDPTDRMGTVSDLLGGKKRTVYTVKPSDTAKVAVELMKRHGVSQLPVVDGDKPIAMLHEVDLLQALLEGRHELDEPVSAVMKPIDGVVTLRTPVSRLRELFAKDQVAIVKDGDQVAAIVTKIDLIEWLAAR